MKFKSLQDTGISNCPYYIKINRQFAIGEHWFVYVCHKFYLLSEWVCIFVCSSLPMVRFFLIVKIQDNVTLFIAITVLICRKSTVLTQHNMLNKIMRCLIADGLIYDSESQNPKLRSQFACVASVESHSGNLLKHIKCTSYTLMACLKYASLFATQFQRPFRASFYSLT